MEFYFAPLEGITGYIYRNAYSAYFDKADKYFTPFISPCGKKGLSSKERNDVLPEHNEGLYVVPQILTKNARDFVQACGELKEYGYREVNLNLGCPSGTVVNKGRGAGFLAQKEELQNFLDEVFAHVDVEISIKTRIGKDDVAEWPELLALFNRYPLKELIVHPRIQKDFYNGTPRLEEFDYGMQNSQNPLCYNGDIVTPDNYQNICAKFGDMNQIMIGRGFLRNPFLLEELRTQTNAGAQGNTKTERKAEQENIDDPLEAKKFKIKDINRLKEFQAKLVSDYKEVMSGEVPVLFKMKELWFYMKDLFPGDEKLYKKIKKTKSLGEYESVVRTALK